MATKFTKRTIAFIKKLPTLNQEQLQGVISSYKHSKCNSALKVGTIDRIGQHIRLIEEFKTDSDAFCRKYTKILGQDVCKTSVAPLDVADTRTLNDLQIDDLVLQKRAQIKDSAQKRGKDFGMTLAEIRKLLLQRTCSYSGVRFSTKDASRMRTFERVDPNKGYVDGNVIVVTALMNTLKNNFFEAETVGDVTPKQLLKFANKMVKLSNKGVL